MKKLDRLVKAAMVQADTKAQIRKKEVFERMTTEQLSELVNGNPSDERIKEILAAVDGLWLLKEGEYRMAKRNLKLDTPDNIRKALAKVANMTYKGEIDTKTANSITATCNVILSGIRVDDQEKKIAELERILNENEDN